MRKGLLLTWTLLGCFSLSTVFAADNTLKEGLTITIYNQNRALVKDTRNIDLKTGENDISFSDISNQILPETVLLSGKGIQVLEQNFNFDLLTHENMMKKAVGTLVDVEFINPATGEVKTKTAELLAYNGGKPVLKIDNRIETQVPARVVFKSVPESLYSRPTLIFKMLSAEAGQEPIELSYLTSGLSWKADYVAELNADDTKLDVNGLVTLTNGTEVDYKNAELQLVAGDVKIRRARSVARAKGVMLEMDGADLSFAENAMSSESISGYYLYTLNRPTDIMAKQTKQVSLLSGNDIKVERRYIYRNAEYGQRNPMMEFSFENEKENGLGVPLPKGMVRVYKKDSKGRLIFVGEDEIPHTAQKQKVKLVLGNDFDITSEGKVLERNKISRDVTETSYEVAISNAKIVPVDVYVYQSMGGKNWKILSESIPSQKEDASTVVWKVPVKAEGKTVLNFKVQTAY